MSDVEPSGPGDLARVVREWRERRHLSQEGLSRAAGLSDVYVTHLESGRRGKRPGRDNVLRLAQTLGAPANELLAAAGLPLIAETDAYPSFSTVVTMDPLLRSDQKDVLMRLYSVFVGKTAG
jgi:transcriptional regulator with XRE-family HTH domain